MSNARKSYQVAFEKLQSQQQQFYNEVIFETLEYQQKITKELLNCLNKKNTMLLQNQAEIFNLDFCELFKTDMYLQNALYIVNKQ